VFKFEILENVRSYPFFKNLLTFSFAYHYIPDVSQRAVETSVFIIVKSTTAPQNVGYSRSCNKELIVQNRFLYKIIRFIQDITVLWFCVIHLLIARFWNLLYQQNLGVQPLNFKTIKESFDSKPQLLNGE